MASVALAQDACGLAIVEERASFGAAGESYRAQYLQCIILVEQLRPARQVKICRV